jgi:hypothetical protein
MHVLVFVVWFGVVLGAAGWVVAGPPRVVRRGHPPTTFGTYPRGGCARVLIVDGLILFMFERVGIPVQRTADREGVPWPLRTDP